MTDDAAKLEKDWHELVFGVRKSVRYHMRRERFLRTCHRWVNFINILSGSATIALVLNGPGAVFAPIIAGLVVIVSTADLVLAFGAQADLHNALRRRFLAL